MAQHRDRGLSYRRNEENLFPHDVKDLSKISGKKITEWAGHIAEALVKGDRLKTHQLRNIYSSIESLRTTFQREKKIKREREDQETIILLDPEQLGEKAITELEDNLFLLLPKLAYAAGRQRSVNATLFPFIKKAIDTVEAAEDKTKAFRNFFVLIESVVGYHKYFEKNRDATLNL